MTMVDHVASVLLSQLGYEESPRGSNHSKFGTWYGVQGAWCAMFQSWGFWTAGNPLHITTQKGFAYCPFGEEWFRQHGRWHAAPQRGDLVFYDWNGDGTADHVGFVLQVHDTYLITVEGNTGTLSQNNGGAVMKRTRDRNSTIRGYGRPVYLDSADPAPVSAPAFHRVLALTSPYMRGTDVRQWQAQMQHRGWKLTVDGYYGPQSRGVCTAFQHDKHLDVPHIGQVDSRTWYAAWRLPVT